MIRLGWNQRGYAADILDKQVTTNDLERSRELYRIKALLFDLPRAPDDSTVLLISESTARLVASHLEPY